LEITEVELSQQAKKGVDYSGSKPSMVTGESKYALLLIRSAEDYTFYVAMNL
jgi:hypothetical protein